MPSLSKETLEYVIAAIRDGRDFIAEELKVRQQTYLPGATPDELAEIHCAHENVEVLNTALFKLGAKP